MKKKYCIMGLGKTGLSCLRYLIAEGHEVCVTDSRDHPPGLAELRHDFAQIPISLGRFDQDFLMTADEIVLSPGIALSDAALKPALEKGTPVVGDIELFANVIKSPVVGITGSNGKSTVTTLVGEMARAAGIKVGVGGNIGLPVLDLLMQGEHDLYVLELSSFQLETTNNLKLETAVILNLTADHLDRYVGMQEYLAAKQRIYRHCKHPVINRDQLSNYQGLDLVKPVSFGLNEPKDGEFGLRDGYLAYGAENLLAVEKLKLKGRHQYANMLAALALGHAIHLPMDTMLDVLQRFTGLPHRCQWVTRYQSMDWYNDSKATNIGSAQASIQGLGEDIKGKIILLAGGLGKNADFNELKPTIANYCRHVILFGRDAKQIAAAIDGVCEISFVVDLEQAVQTAMSVGQPDDVVLLAPACASFDMFRDFEHRGDAFTALVRGLS